ncbi:hypothetical protein DFH27DRAFT_561519 [Peziza echinospora]|nr:hypothetical protein DFH27DRAFT_561519 [Peziza echinospora]
MAGSMELLLLVLLLLSLCNSSLRLSMLSDRDKLLKRRAPPSLEADFANSLLHMLLVDVHILKRNVPLLHNLLSLLRSLNRRAETIFVHLRRRCRARLPRTPRPSHNLCMLLRRHPARLTPIPTISKG